MKGGTIHAIDANGKITVRHNAPLIAEAASPQPVIGALPRSVERPNPECGVNALYIFLRLRGTDCALDQIRQKLPLTAQGANMLDLQRVASEHKVDTAVVSLSPEQFEDTVPFIARVKAVGTGFEGHYVVVTRVTGDQVDLLDSTAGGSVTMPRATFERDFSGYALVEAGGPSGGKWLRIVLAVVCAVELVLFGYFLLAGRGLGGPPSPSASVPPQVQA